MFDVLITVADKDFNKLRFVYDSIKNNLEGVDKVYIVSNVRIPQNKAISGIIYLTDDNVSDFDYSKFTGVIKERTGWYKQQFIKLFQEVTRDDYIVIDADVVLNKKINIVMKGKPSFLFGKNQYNEHYFRLMKNLFNIEKVHPYSFINEIMYFKRDIITHLLSSLGVNKYGFFELVVNELNKENQVSGFSEYELYGNYVAKYFPDIYNCQYLETKSKGRSGVWTDFHIINCLHKYKGFSDVS
jgi:hypothetical protein